MRKAIVILALCLVPFVAQAQSLNADNLSVTFAVGGAIPARSDVFQDKAGVTFYRGLFAEYAVSPAVAVYGAYDRSKFPVEGGTDVKVVGWGGGLILRTGITEKLDLGLKMGGAKNDADPGGAEWQPAMGAFLDFIFKNKMHGRVGVDFRDVANQGTTVVIEDEKGYPVEEGFTEIGSLFLYLAVNFSPLEIWR